MEITVKHKLGTQEALNRIKELSVELKKKYGDQLKNYQENWDGNKAEVKFKVMGFNIEGILEIFEEEVFMRGKVPMMLKAFEGQVKEQITEVLTDLLK